MWTRYIRVVLGFISGVCFIGTLLAIQNKLLLLTILGVGLTGLFLIEGFER